MSDLKEDWMQHGNCQHYPPAVMFPSDGAGVAAARKVCDICPVKDQCLEFALDNRIDHGVWGGAGERERRRMRKQRQLEASVWL